MSNRIIIGVDEVGRGCLFGPVVAGAVVLPETHYPWMDEIKDSKLLTAKKRERLAAEITYHCYVGIREVSAELVDKMNILYASLYAMKLAIDDVYFLSPADKKPNVVLIDGNQTIPTDEGWFDLPMEQHPIVGGDNLHKAIGAASIVAKVYRDKLMVEYDALYPEYGLKRNKGYGSVEHRKAIVQYGPKPEHRQTFSGVYQYVR